MSLFDRMIAEGLSVHEQNLRSLVSFNKKRIMSARRALSMGKPRAAAKLLDNMAAHAKQVADGMRSAGGVEESEPHPDSPAGITAHFRREREMKLKVARAKKERAKAEREWNKKRKAGR